MQAQKARRCQNMQDFTRLEGTSAGKGARQEQVQEQGKSRREQETPTHAGVILPMIEEPAWNGASSGRSMARRRSSRSGCRPVSGGSAQAGSEMRSMVIATCVPVTSMPRECAVPSPTRAMTRRTRATHVVAAEHHGGSDITRIFQKPVSHFEDSSSPAIPRPRVVLFTMISMHPSSAFCDCHHRANTKALVGWGRAPMARLVRAARGFFRRERTCCCGTEFCAYGV
jgi:hypothetical protein